MATVYVTLPPSNNGPPRTDAIEIDGGGGQKLHAIAIDIGDARLNLIQAAAKGGIEIPFFCWHPALTVVASCRMCLVEVGERKPDGSITLQKTMTGENKVVPACQTPARDGTVCVTEYTVKTGTAPGAACAVLTSIV